MNFFLLILTWKISATDIHVSKPCVWVVINTTINPPVTMQMLKVLDLVMKVLIAIHLQFAANWI